MRLPPRFQVLVDSIYTLVLRRKSVLSLNKQASSLKGIVCSPGGVATTELMRHIARFITINHPGDADGLKHMRGPLNSKIPTLYIYGNEDQIIASLERRNYAIPHLVKLGGLSDLVAGTLFRLRAKTLKRLIRRQKESFWNAEEEGRRVLCVDFDEVWSSSEVISKFFGISDDRFLSEYPRRKPRVTDG